MGIVDQVGPGVKHLQKGQVSNQTDVHSPQASNRMFGVQRVVVSFQIACGECRYCKQKLSSFCDRTNDSSLMQTM